MKTTKNIQKALVGLILLITSIVLSLITAPIGILFGMIFSLFSKGLRGFGHYCTELALSIDKTGNICLQYLFNQLFIRKEGYRFGNRHETISSVIGKNLQTGTLRPLGKLLNALLHFFDRDHSLNSIDYTVEKPLEKK
ncbi:MAG: hypothetical protein EP338_04225 [Bacteroidetes bacterium]|nr:MAG: hypothetical protein EP338_04225 [Bacteroidota bacterium]